MQPDRTEAHGRGAATAGSSRCLPRPRSDNRGQANYSTAKAGLQGFTKTLAIELGPFGVTANAIAPGFIETAMTKATAERIGTTIEQMREERRGDRSRCAAAALPADIANAVAFFAGEESGYVTGQVLYVDGGRGLL